MSNDHTLTPDYLFEVSWEVCNKIGGIHTVITSKAPIVQKSLKDNYILIGPDVWKETIDNPEFEEGKTLFRLWREKAAAEGLHFRIGRWNIPGNPLVILVDFTPYFQGKDKIFEELWLSYKVDSISGQWDYVEPALFGYAAAKVIESYYDYYNSAQDNIVAHFHEWMTGTGVLYLKENVPQIGTVFTTHATVSGRAISNNDLPLYRNLAQYDGDEIARRFNILSKHSLEKTTAHECDVFTTVSEIASAQCEALLKRVPDMITLNGIGKLLDPASEEFAAKRGLARKKILEVASAVVSQPLGDDSMLLLTSGRYEYRNKGIDVFIGSLAELNSRLSDQDRTVVAVIALSTNQVGPRRELVERLKSKDFTSPSAGKYHTHTLFSKDQDIVLTTLREKGLLNRPEDKVKVVFVPCYLNGTDGIFDISYNDLLPAFDLTVFPSYYEPWGYTSLESIANGVPTISTSLAGFALYVRSQGSDYAPAVTVIDRDDDNARPVLGTIAENIMALMGTDAAGIALVRRQGYAIAQLAHWNAFIGLYEKSYRMALQKVDTRQHLFRTKQQYAFMGEKPKTESLRFEWKKVFIKPTIPDNLKSLDVLSRNLWWSWNREAVELFENIHPAKWKESQHNPIALLESLTYKEIQDLSANREFLSKLDMVSDAFMNYMAAAGHKSETSVAYFSMEFGIHDSLKIYSGGLGVLAGDYLKEASDRNQNMVGIGLLYRYGYFQQNLSLMGEQVANLVPQKFSQMAIQPVRDNAGNWVTISLVLPGRKMLAKVWRADVGRIPLYLLDADIPENIDIDKSVTHQLYGGDLENRFKQELLLGVGGMRMLETLGLKPTLFHLNEGHAAFATLERLRYFVQNERLNFRQASEMVRATCLFTTHTPVPAGHDEFPEEMLRTYIPHYAERLIITWDEFMDLGRWTAGASGEKFSMSVLAARLSQEMNGVSKIHERVTREMFVKLYPGYYPEELHIGSVTNGVHFPTWTASRWQQLYEKQFGRHFLDDQANPAHWKKIYEVDNQTIWDIRNHLRTELINYLKLRVHADLKRRQEAPKTISRILESMDGKALTIGFARRFATYKRAHLLFNDLDRLKELINTPGRPVQLIFAGKAHPADKAGQELIKRIMQISKSPEFLGKITFVENYDMELASKLVQGVDVWLNTPTRPLEASGTSGEKAVMNGVMNLSVLDGWYAEGYKPNAGWALPEERTYTNQDLQDELDSLSIYNILEQEVIPKFYSRNEQGVAEEWVQYIKHTIALIAPHFTMKRMLDDYINRYYLSMADRAKKLADGKYELVREISSWKRRVMLEWDHLEVVEIKIPDATNAPLSLGDVFKAEVIIDTNSLSADDLGIEVLFGQKENDVVEKIQFRKELVLTRVDGKKATFSLEFKSEKSGVFDYAFRMYPKNDLLPHWQDLHLVKLF